MDSNDEHNDYNHHQEAEWDVWVRKQTCSAVESKTSKLPLSTSEYYKIVTFYIKHLHMSQQKDRYFEFKNIPFLYVYVSGTVVSKNVHKEKLCLEVNDGTGSITCLIEDDMLNDTENERAKLKNLIDNTTCSNNVEEDTLVQAALINMHATHKLLKRIPRKDEFHTGIIVGLFGKLSEYNGKKYVFVTKINSISVGNHIKNLKRSLSLRDEDDED